MSSGDGLPNQSLWHKPETSDSPNRVNITVTGKTVIGELIQKRENWKNLSHLSVLIVSKLREFKNISTMLSECLPRSIFYNEYSILGIDTFGVRFEKTSWLLVENEYSEATMSNKIFGKDPFEHNFDRVERNVGRFFKFGLIAWGLWLLFCLSLIGGGLYVAIHFISKYW